MVVLVVITTHCEPLSTVWTVRMGLKPNVAPAWLVACLYKMVNGCNYQPGKTLQPLLNPPCNGAGVRQMNDNSKVRRTTGCRALWAQEPGHKTVPGVSNPSASLRSSSRETLCLMQLQLWNLHHFGEQSEQGGLFAFWGASNQVVLSDL